MDNFTLTKEQQDIVDFFETLLSDKKYSSMAIKAFAGCGKSFILNYLAKKHTNKKFLGLAFNNSIYKENKKSFPKRNCSWFTVHGFAREYLKKNGENIDFKNSVSDYKDIEILHILEIEDQSDYVLGKCINDIMKVYCQSSLKEITPENIKKAGKSQLNSDIIEMNSAYLDLGCKYALKWWKLFENNSIAPTFDFYLKYFEVNRFAEKISDFDILELDEAQDSNAVTMSIATQLPTKNIYVGDEHQSIYAFRGTLNAMRYADKLFYLSTTFRYIPKIAAYANNILSSYKKEKVPIRSLAKKGGKSDGITAYISRNNSTMISLIADLIANNKHFTTVKDPDDLFEAALAILEFRTEKKVARKNYMYLSRFQSIEQLEEYITETNDNNLKTAFKMQKRYGKGLYILLKTAKQNLKSKDDTEIILTTAHTSKGLEFDNVVLLSDFPDIPQLLQKAKITTPKDLLIAAKKNDLTASNIIQEINLFYVAVTRARYNFNYINIESE